MKWVPDNLDNYLNFYSISGDGRVTNWTLIKCGLWYNDKLIINFDKVLENISAEMVSDHLMGKRKLVIPSLRCFFSLLINSQLNSTQLSEE